MAAGDEQDQAEAYDTDKLDDDVDEPVEHLTYPPERPLGVNDPTADDLVADSVTSRHARERPDPIEVIGREDAADPVDATGVAVEDDDEFAPLGGRLVEPGADDDAYTLVDDEKDEIAGAVPADDLSAEEAAIHLEPG